MWKKQRGKTYYGISKNLGKRLLRADDFTLSMICERIMDEIAYKATLPSTRDLVESCRKDASSVTESYLLGVKEIVCRELVKEPGDRSVLDRDDALIDICWGYVLGESMFNKCDSMIYQAGRFPRQERDDLYDHALNETIGWSSRHC